MHAGHSHNSLVDTLSNPTATQIKLSFFQQEIFAAEALRNSLRDIIDKTKLKSTPLKRQRRKSINSFNSSQEPQDQTENIIGVIENVRKQIACEKQKLEEVSFSCGRNADANSSPLALEFQKMLAQKRYERCVEDLDGRAINCEQLVKQQQNLKKSGKIMQPTQPTRVYSLKKVSKMKKVALYLKRKAGAKEKLQRHLQSLRELKLQCESMVAQRQSNPIARALFDSPSFHAYRTLQSGLYACQSAPVLTKAKKSLDFIPLVSKIKKLDCSDPTTNNLLSEVLLNKLHAIRTKISSLARKNEILKQAIRIREEKRALHFIRHKNHIELSLQEGAMKQILEHQEFSRSYPLNLSVAFDHYKCMSLAKFKDWKRNPQYLNRIRQWPLQTEVWCEEVQRHQSCDSKEKPLGFSELRKKMVKLRIVSPLKNPNGSDPNTASWNEG